MTVSICGKFGLFNLQFIHTGGGIKKLYINVKEKVIAHLPLFINR